MRGATSRTPHKKWDLTIGLNALSNSMVRRHRPSSLLWLCSRGPMTWTVVSKPLAVPSSNCDGRRARVMSSDTVSQQSLRFETSESVSHGQRSVAAVFLRQCRERGTGKLADDENQDCGLLSSCRPRCRGARTLWSC